MSNPPHNLPPNLLVRVSYASLKLRTTRSHQLPKGIESVGQILDLGYEIVSMVAVNGGGKAEADDLMIALRALPAAAAPA